MKKSIVYLILWTSILNGMMSINKDSPQVVKAFCIVPSSEEPQIDKQPSDKKIHLFCGHFLLNIEKSVTMKDPAHFANNRREIID